MERRTVLTHKMVLTDVAELLTIVARYCIEHKTVRTNTRKNRAVLTRTAEDRAVLTHTAENRAVLTHTAENRAILTHTAEKTTVPAQKSRLLAPHASVKGARRRNATPQLEVTATTSCLRQRKTTTKRSDRDCLPKR